MQFLKNIWRWRKQRSGRALFAEVCTHEQLVPRWDRHEEMGDPERVSWYLCPLCSIHLAPTEARRLRGLEPAPKS